MKPFLKTLAELVYTRYDDLSDICFVFPNKRSGRFFLKYIKEVAERDIVAPEVTTITDFVGALSGRVIASRIDLLLRLYKIYRDYVREYGGEENTEFESFRVWGETVLSDFSEVDQYLVEPSELFKNVKDFKEISTNYLTEEQKRVIRDYFGRDVVSDTGSFWRNFNSKPEKNSPLKTKYIRLWESLLPLYERLEQNLQADCLTTSGGAYRLAVERVENIGTDGLPWNKIFFVGFNALSSAEHRLFTLLSKLPSGISEDEPYADFFWDGTGPVLEGEDNSSSTFLMANRRDFPQPEWGREKMKESDARSFPAKMEIIAAPSNSSQAKLVGDKLRQWISSLDTAELNDAKVAVVLPDENMLLPILYSLPDNVNEVNLTMGYSLKLTSAYSFVKHLQRLYGRVKRNNEGEKGFYYEDLSLFLSHPFSHLLFGTDTVARLNSFIARYHKYVVTPTEIAEFSAPASSLLTYLTLDLRAVAVLDYIDMMLEKVDQKLTSDVEGIVKSRLDRSHIVVYRDALRVLKESITRHEVNFSGQEAFFQASRLVSGENVVFEGEPLQGLQVMGLLETRLLDFDYLVVPSLNEGYMPRRMRKRTFIPNTLRAGYGLPPANYQESVFSYYFYRLISRCRDVALLYNAAGGESGKKDISRYLLQLQNLYARDMLPVSAPHFNITENLAEVVYVKKSSRIMERLEDFKGEDALRALSASGLKKYCACPIRFYYEVVVGLRNENPPTDTIDAATQGSIVHAVLQNLYLPEHLQGRYLESPVKIEKARIEGWLNDPQKIEKMVWREVNSRHFNFRGKDLDRPVYGAVKLVADRLVENVIMILRHDVEIAPFHIAGVEVKGETLFHVDEGLDLKMKYIIDRIDIPGDGDLTGLKLRIVDYKTGSPRVAAESFSDVFNGNSDAGNMFQMMLYAHLFSQDHQMEKPIKMAIYTPDIRPSGVEVRLSVGKHEVEDHHAVSEEFLGRFREMLKNIYDPERGFQGSADKEHCRYCGLYYLCGRKNE